MPSFPILFAATRASRTTLYADSASAEPKENSSTAMFYNDHCLKPRCDMNALSNPILKASE